MTANQLFDGIKEEHHKNPLSQAVLTERLIAANELATDENELALKMDIAQYASKNINNKEFMAEFDNSFRTKKSKYIKLPSHDLREASCTFSPSKPSRNFDFIEFIQSQSKIRLVIDDGPNYGNQAANINLISELRNLGYTGIIEIIYPAMQATKLLELMDDEDLHNLKFISAEEYFRGFQSNSQMIEQVTLSMSGAIDESIPKTYLQRFGLNANGVSVSLNYADFFKSKIFIRLSPYHEVDKAKTILYLQDNPIPIFLDGSEKQALVVPVATLKDAKSYIHKNPNDEYVANHPSVLTIIESIERGDLNFLPAYGKTLHSTNNFKIFIVSVIDAYLLSKPSKPLIIGLFFQLNKTSKSQIKDMLSSRNVQLAELSQRYITGIVDNLTSGEILLLEFGNMPKKIFDGLFTFEAENVWPCIREGAGTLTTLISTTHTPHLYCKANVEWEIDTVNAPEEVKKLFSMAGKLCGDEISDPMERSAWNSRYILEALNPKSKLSVYYKKYMQDLRSPYNRRLYIALKVGKELAAMSSEESQNALQPYLHEGRFTGSALIKEIKPSTSTLGLGKWFDSFVTTLSECKTYFNAQCPVYNNNPATLFSSQTSQYVITSYTPNQFLLK